jgi:hypothetical protein
MNNLTPLQIAIYAINCPKEDRYFEEVAKMIDDYAKNKKNHSNIDVLPCQYCKTSEFVIHNTHGLNDQCWKCGAYVRKPYLSEQTK